MKKLFFIFNPQSGKANIKAKIGSITDIFTKNDYMVTVYPTQCRLDGSDKAWYACESGYDLIVCSGGDGTLNEIIQGIMMAENRIPLGYIPTGTTNDFARSIGIPRGIENAAQFIMDGEPFSCDVGVFNNRYFTYIAAFGAFTEVSYETSQQFKNVMGHAAYIMEGVKSLMNIKHYHMIVQYDNVTLEDDFVYGMVTNSASVGGVLSQDGVMFDDGVYEVTLIKKPENVANLHQIAQALLKLSPDNEDTKNVITFRTSKITFKCENEVSWTLDGEFGGNEKEAVIQNLNKAIDFQICKEAIKDRIAPSDDYDYVYDAEDDTVK